MIKNERKFTVMNNMGNPTDALKLRAQRQKYTSNYTNARANIMVMVVFTVINIFLLFVGNTYFLFSAFIPYIIADFGFFFAGRYPADFYGEDAIILGDGALVVCLVIAAVFLALYVLAWIFSKKHVGWMIFALVFFSLDTLFLLLGMSIDLVIDLVFHAWIIVILAIGIHAHFKLQKLPEVNEAEFVAIDQNGETFAQVDPASGDFQVVDNVNLDSNVLRYASNDGKIRILAQTEALGHQIVYRRANKVNELVIDGKVYDEFKPGFVETSHTLAARVGGHIIEAGLVGGSQSFIDVDGARICKKVRWI